MRLAPFVSKPSCFRNRNLLLILERQLLFFLFLLLLVLNVLADHLCIQTYRVNTVSFGPEVVTPVRLHPQPWELLENPDSRTSLQGSHQVRNRDLRRHHRNQMHMILLNVQLHYLTALSTREDLYTLTLHKKVVEDQVEPLDIDMRHHCIDVSGIHRWWHSEYTEKARLTLGFLAAQ